MDLNLSGKVAVVTGASKGIGLAVVRALAAEGASVVAGARHGSAELTTLAESAPVHVVAVDLTTPDGPGRSSRRPSPSTAGWTSWSTTSALSGRASTVSSR